MRDGMRPLLDELKHIRYPGERRDAPLTFGEGYRFNLQFFAQDPDKTEEATPKRKSEARKKGQVPKSSELNAVVVLMGLFFILNFLGEWFFQEIFQYFRRMLSPTQVNLELSDTNLRTLFLSQVIFFGRVFLPLGLAAMVLGFAVNYIQVGQLFTLEPLKPKFNRLNPIRGFQRLMSMQGLVELAKAALKLTVVGYVTYGTLRDNFGVLLQSLEQSPLKAATDIWRILYNVALKVCMLLLVVAVLDLYYQRYQHRKSLRMSKKEVKDEIKQQEGNPQIKGKIRQRQRQIAMRRMMQEVPKADVVITNPTHYAVALRYDARTMSAPVVVAKGEGFIAARIKEIAKEHNVAIVENKPLAQALYRTVEIGEVIPAKLFQAVAEVLAFVYRLRQNRRAR